MYKVIQSSGETSLCDAIETVTVIDGKITPIEQLRADGFRALTIVYISPSEEYFDEALYAFPDHTLGDYDAPTATFEDEEEVTT